MRFSIKLTLKEKKLPLEYRRMLLSFFKYTFKSASEKVFEQFYNKKDPNLKPFTFAVFLPNPKFDENCITIETNNISMNFSTNDYKAGIVFYNGLLGNKKREFEYKYSDKIYTLHLQNVYLNAKEKKKFDNEIVFKTLSPFVVRKHNKKLNKDIYLKPEDDDFTNSLFENTKLKVKNILGYTINSSDISFMPVKLKKIPVKHYNHFVEAQHGIIKISGNPDIIKMIYNIGLGANNGYGFGMLEVLG